MDKALLACPKCGAFYSVKSGALSYKCEKCSATLENVNIAYATWENMNERQREQYKKAYREERACDRKIKTKYQEYEELPESSWTTALGCLGWLIVIGGVIGAVVMFMSGQLLLAAVPLAISIMCAAVAMVLKEVAEDTRATRNMLQKYINNQR